MTARERMGIHCGWGLVTLTGLYLLHGEYLDAGFSLCVGIHYLREYFPNEG